MDPRLVRLLLDLVEVDGKLFAKRPCSEDELRTIPGLAQLLAQRLYLLEKLEKEFPADD